MDNKCKYVETTEYGKYCVLSQQGCNDEVPETNVILLKNTGST